MSVIDRCEEGVLRHQVVRTNLANLSTESAMGLSSVGAEFNQIPTQRAESEWSAMPSSLPPALSVASPTGAVHPA